MHRTFRLAIAASLLFVSSAAMAAPPRTGLDRSGLDREIERLMQNANVAGLGVAVIEHGEIAHLRAYGQRDIERNLPLTPDSVMYAASLTKALAAYAMLGLVDDGRLDLDASIATLLPKPLPAYEKYADLANDPRWRAITPRMLLSHRAGFPNFRFFTAKGYDEHAPLRIEFEPGSRYAYSGEGINLMQFVVEVGLGIDLAELVQARVFGRFGMRRSALTWREEFADELAISHGPQGESLGHKRRSSVRAAGSMDTTLRDYAAFLAGVARGDGLSASTYQEMFRTQMPIDSVQQFPTLSTDTTTDNRGIGLGAGLGWIVYDGPGGRAFFKGGHDDGTNNLALCVENGARCVLLLSNSSNGDSIFKPLIDTILGPTCYPWFWQNHVPFDQPALREPAARALPHPPCDAEAK